MTRILTTLYALTAIGCFHAAILSHGQGNTPWALFFSAASITLGTAIVHTSCLRDYALNALDELEHAARTADRRPALDDAVALEVAAACCEVWWTSAGAEHDPDHCTRKDQTT